MSTAIEWLFEQLWETPKDKFVWNSILEEALKKEKEQIENAYWDGGQDIPCNAYTCEQYYHKTYNQNK